MTPVNSSHLVVTVLGSGACVPSHARYPASYFVRSPVDRGGWLIDIGPGALQRLAAAGGSYKEIERLFVSHAHADHVSSLLPLLQALNFTPGFKRFEPFFIYGPQTVKRYIERNLDLAPSLRPSFEMHFIVLTDRREVEYDGWSIVSRSLKHSTSTQGFRFTVGGCTLVYGADTEPCDEIVELAQRADLVILESSFRRHNPSPGHLTTFQAGEIARAAQAKRLLLSHFYPEVAEMDREAGEAEVRASGYAGEVIFAEDLMTVGVCADD